MTQEEVEFFDRLAPDWDANEVRSTPERVEAILDMIEIGQGESVLDLGTGTGVLIPYLIERVGENGHVTGVDLSEGMLDLARAKYGHYRNADLLKIDFEEEQIPGIYDLAMLYSVYPHLHYPQDTLAWLFKMNLKPGGRVVVAFPSDEKFINAIHHERASDSDHLKPARKLAEEIRGWGYEVIVASDTPDAYVLIIKSQSE